MSIIRNDQYNQLGCSLNLSWRAILVGTIVSLGCEILLNFLGIGLGFTSFNLDPDRTFKIGIGAILWLAISGVVAMAIGGFFIGALSNIPCKTTRAYHGVAAWSLATLIVISTASTIPGLALLGGASNVASNMVGAMPQNALMSNQSKDVVTSQIKQSASDEVSQADTAKAVEATNSAGKISLVMFAAFLLSAIASAVGAIYGYKNSSDEKYGLLDTPGSRNNMGSGKIVE